MRGLTRGTLMALCTLAPLSALAGTGGLRAQARPLAGRDRWADSAGALIASGTQRGTMATLLEAQVLLDRALTVYPNDPLLLHYRGYGLYRQANLAASAPGSSGKADSLLAAAEEALEKSGAALALPETFALEAAVLGQRIALSSDPASAGMLLGPQSASASQRAQALGQKNPRVWLLRGIGELFTPSEYGGGLDLAERDLTRATSLFESDTPAPPLPSWGHAEAFIWLGQTYLKEGKREAARQAFEKATRLEPQNERARRLLASTTTSGA